MPKKSRDELLKSIESLSLDDDSKIQLMEDVTDSIDRTEEIDSLKSENESLKKDIELWKEKYKDRFMSNEELKEIKEVEVEEPKKEELKKYIDVKEI